MLSLKSTRIAFWSSTIFIGLLLIPGVFQLNDPKTLEVMKHLEVPRWLHREITIGKFIGGVILLLPVVPKRIREWAYVAIGIDFISAFIALIAIDGPSTVLLIPVFAFILLLTSYLSYHKLQAHEKK